MGSGRGAGKKRMVVARGATLFAVFKTANSLTRHGLCPSLFHLCGGKFVGSGFTIVKATEQR